MFAFKGSKNEFVDPTHFEANGCPTLLNVYQLFDARAVRLSHPLSKSTTKTKGFSNLRIFVQVFFRCPKIMADRGLPQSSLLKSFDRQLPARPCLRGGMAVR